ncbi:MAG: hypothetical protein ACF8CQ_08825 [Rhodopirellula sp. JB044]|uniref:hypothetical protein n=1 Tax=Rhodopirellula sp. JB044 TaxID=3342844 RepID=UPI003709EAAE
MHPRRQTIGLVLKGLLLWASVVGMGLGVVQSSANADLKGSLDCLVADVVQPNTLYTESEFRWRASSADIFLSGLTGVFADFCCLHEISVSRRSLSIASIDGSFGASLVMLGIRLQI